MCHLQQSLNHIHFGNQNLNGQWQNSKQCNMIELRTCKYYCQLVQGVSKKSEFSRNWLRKILLRLVRNTDAIFKKSSWRNKSSCENETIVYHFNQIFTLKLVKLWESYHKLWSTWNCDIMTYCDKKMRTVFELLGPLNIF